MPVVHADFSRTTGSGACLTEASEIQTGPCLCRLFASMLIFCQLAAPENLWDRFRNLICDDLFCHVPNPTPERVYNYGLFLLNSLLTESGYCLENFPKMPISEQNWNRVNGNYLITEQLCYDVASETQSL